MARHSIWARLLIVVLLVVALPPWPSARSQAQARQPIESTTSSVAHRQLPPAATAAADPAGSPTGRDDFDLDVAPTAIEPQPSAPTAIQEITALAAGLENDPLAIYDYVHNHIDYIPTWGLFKSPRETLLSGEGNPFDQAALLAALLNAAGYSTQYVRGDIRLTNQQAIDWTGAADREAAIQIFLAGRIQFIDELDPATVRIRHVWVRLNDGGSHDLDPSFKSYSVRAGQDLHPLLGFNPATFISRAQSGANITPTSTQHLNLANIQADATSYAMNLVSNLRINKPFASVEDLIGGRQIESVSSSGYPTSPYQVASSATAANLSDVTYSLNISLSTIDYPTTTASLDGQRITIFYECATPVDCQTLQAGGGIYNVAPPTSVNMVPKLRIGGQLVDTGAAAPLGSSQQLEIAITTPGPSPQMISFSRELLVGGWYALPVRLQGISNRSLGRQIDVLEEAMTQGLALGDERVLGQILHVIGLAYYNELGLGDRIDSRLAKVAILPYFSVMVSSRDIIVYLDNQEQPVDIDPGAHTVDVGMHVSNAVALASGPDAQSRKRAWFLSAGVRSSAAEHAILEQLQPAPAISTVQVLQRAAADGQIIYYITPSNANTLLPLLEYSPETINRIIDALNLGKEIVVPKGPVTYDQWHGTGWIELNPTTGLAGYIISGGLGVAQGAKPLTIQGGGSTRPTSLAESALVLVRLAALLQRLAVGQRSLPGADGLPTNSDFESIPDTQTVQYGDTGRAMTPIAGDPINVIAGAFLYQQRDLAQAGGLGIPLGFERFYSSERHNLAGPLGYGWSHTYNTSFAIGTEWARGFGERTALEAAPALAAAQIGADLFNVANIPQQRFAMDAIVGQWLMTKITGNAAVVTNPNGTVAAHVRLIDGIYQAPATVANLNTVSIAGDGSATLVWENGIRMLFDPAGRPTALDDANGKRTTLSYNAQGRLSQVADAVGRTLVFSYNAQGRLSQVADAAGRLYRYSYDGQGNLQIATNPRGGTTTYLYDAAHRITRITDPIGTAYVDSQYDALGRVSAQTNGRGGQIRLLYGGDHTILVDPLGYRSIFFYDARDRLLAVQNSLGIRRSIVYDAADHMTRFIGGLGQVLAFAYDPRGHLTTTTDPLNQTTVWSYDATGNPVGFTNQLGKLWRFAYDSAHNLTRATDPLGNATNYTYNAQGQLTAIQDAISTSTLSYDSYGNLKCLQNALGHSNCLVYDIVGRPTRFTDGTGEVTQFSYDANDNLVKIVEPTGGQTSYAYDGNDNLASMTDANGHITHYTYDAQFNLISVTDALGGITRYTYNPNDQLIRLTDANGHVTNYQRDQVGRVTSIADPLNRSITFGYDNGDRLISLKRADGSTIGYTYNALGRLTGITNPTGPNDTFFYDATGRMSSAAHGTAWSASYQYDAAGRLTGVVEAGRKLTTHYTYDQAGRRTGLNVTRNTTPLYSLGYSYDTADRLIRVTDSTISPTTSLHLSYDEADRLAEIREPSGAQALYTYTAGRLTQVQHLPSQGSAVATYDYAYDAAGNITRVTDTTTAGPFITRYSYDALNRLIQETYPRYDIRYTYDAAGNMVGRVDPLAALTYTYDSADQLLTRGNESFSYDPNGNMSSWQSARGTATYSYDYQNRLTGTNRTDGTTMTFSYDAFGRRLTSQDPSGTRGFLQDGLDTVLEGNADLSQMTARYLYGDGMLLGRYTEQLGLTTYHGDARENVRFLMDASGVPLDEYTYDAFGRAGAPAGVDANPFRFVGQRGVYQHDTAAWPQLLMGHRYYDPDSSRFLTPDPLPGSLLQPASQNGYAYALNNPLRYNDPTGLRQFQSKPARDRRGQGIAILLIIIPLSIPESPRLVPPDFSYGHNPNPNDIRTFRWIWWLVFTRLHQRYPWITWQDFAYYYFLYLNGLSGSTLPSETPPPSREPGEPPQPSAEGDLPGWMRLTKAGGMYALACTPNDHLLGGSFYAGLQWSAIAGHGSWTNVSSVGVGELVIGGGAVYAGARYTGILTSTGLGSWAPANNGLRANDVYALAIDPDSPRRLFAGTEMGLFVSTDAGAHWSGPASTLPGHVVSELAFVGKTLLAITDIGLYRSADGGITWQRPTGDLPAVRIYTLLAGTPAGTVYAGTATGGYISTNSGVTWSPLGTGLAGRPIHALAIDPSNGRHMVAGTTAGIFVSADGGVTWRADMRAGLDGAASQVGALAFCPGGGDMNLYLGTGGGVYAITAQRLRNFLAVIRK